MTVFLGFVKGAEHLVKSDWDSDGLVVSDEVMKCCAAMLHVRVPSC